MCHSPEWHAVQSDWRNGWAILKMKIQSAPTNLGIKFKEIETAATLQTQTLLLSLIFTGRLQPLGQSSPSICNRTKIKKLK